MVRRSVFGGIAAVLMLFSSVPAVLAEDDDACSPVSSAPTGIARPGGADASTYTYNSCTGLWENQYYTWSPESKVATPKSSYIFWCDTTNWKWTYNRWVYSPASGTFHKETFTVDQLPTGAMVDSKSVAPCAPPAAQPTQQNTSSTPSGVTSPAPTNNQTPANADLHGAAVTVDNVGNVVVGNKISSNAQTGDAAATANMAAGNTMSGDANASASVVNSVQTSSTLTGGNVVTFTANLNGDVQGDLVVDPSTIQPASDSKPLADADVTIHSQNSGVINNEVSLNAASGNANAEKNTTVGNVASGNATAIANVINMLNSIVSAGKSFIGVININGSLHGNILVPQSFMGQLLATNAPHSTMTLSAMDAANLGIANTVSNSATTGTANATANTRAGNITSGNSATKVTVFNLTGAQIIGSNCMLVFVNVAGTWVGVIMNAPVGATAAAIGDTSSRFSSPDTTTTGTTTNNAINNNIKVAATSGNATAADNTAVGDIRSGNANTAVNLLNLNNAQLNLSGWFGVLFINVFGNWYGNFGVNKPLPDPVKANPDSSSLPNTNNAATVTHHPVFQFITQAHDASIPVTKPVTDPTLALVSAQLAQKTGKTLGAGVIGIDHSLKAAPPMAHTTSVLQLVGGALTIVGISTLVIERVVSVRQERKLDSAGRL